MDSQGSYQKFPYKKEGDRTYMTGAVRSDETNKGRWDVIYIEALASFDRFYRIIGQAQEYLRKSDVIGAYLTLQDAVDYIHSEGESNQLYRLGQHAEKGAERYIPYNWQKGLPVSRYLGSICRHWMQYIEGYTNEDHITACLWNIHALMWTVRFLPIMNDLPGLYYHAMAEETNDETD